MISTPTTVLAILLVVAMMLQPIEARFGACYSPFHSDSYPFQGAPDAAARLNSIMTQDFAQMKQHTSIIRTYYASFYGQDVASLAQAAGLQVYLGVYLEDPALRELEIQAAIVAATNYPDTVLGILVGNENLVAVGGTWTPEGLVEIITRIRTSISPSNVLIGTTQRINEWLVDEAQSLANACDIIGVNIYPFFSIGWTSTNPLALLDAQWNQMTARYPASKLRVTESGFPTQGTAPAGLPASIPSLENAEIYYRAFHSWIPPNMIEDDNHPHFLFQFFDRHPTEDAPSADYERHFGICDRFGNPKFSLLSATGDEVALPTSESNLAAPESPLTGTPYPAPETPASAPETPSPAPGTPSPAPEAPASAPETPASAPGTPSPETPAPAPGTPAPETLSPAPGTPAPAPEAPASAPETPASAPETPASAPGTPASAPETPSPAPGSPPPAPETSTPTLCRRRLRQEN